MDNKIIENDKNLVITQISKNGVVKRYEIRAADGFEIYDSEDKKVECIMYPAKRKLEDIISEIDIRSSTV